MTWGRHTKKAEKGTIFSGTYQSFICPNRVTPPSAMPDTESKIKYIWIITEIACLRLQIPKYSYPNLGQEQYFSMFKNAEEINILFLFLLHPPGITFPFWV